MFQKARESAYLESTSLLMTFVRWRKPLLVVVLVSSVAAFIFSGPSFIHPKYKSTVVFFPAAATSISKAVLESSPGELVAFGEETQMEQMLQILNSDEIRSIIIKKYDLMKHYRIDPSSSFPVTHLYSQYNDNITYEPTKYLSVQINVLDESPQMAADICNDIASLVDSVKGRLQRDRLHEAMKIVQQEYEYKLALVTGMRDSLKMLREMGLMDYGNQASIYNEEYAKSFSSYNNDIAALPELEKYRGEDDTMVVNVRARIKGAQSRMKNLQSKLDLLAKYGGTNIALNEDLSMQVGELEKLKLQYQKLKIDAEHNIPPKFIINRAVKAEMKSYPVRWLIVLVSVFCSFIVALIAVIIIDRIREIQYHL
jgi:tyrosine-protein kinase Etk/Wzc